MRPLELKVRNFRSYAGEHEFNFADRNLVAIVGPIGSGKSSILDAIVFALYGRTPRIANATKTLINQRSADAAVSLRFEVEGELWEATRSIRIKGASRHALYRYEDPDGEPVERLTLESEVNDKIVELLGLDYAAFERSVLLAQGRFAEFLEARPADRDRVLKGVFGHDRVDRMKALAKERRDQTELDLEKLRVRLERFADIEHRLSAAREDLTVATARRTDLEKAAVTSSEIAKRRAAAEKTVATVGDRVAMLEEQAARLPDPTATQRSIAEAMSIAQQRAELAAQLEDAQEDLRIVDGDLRKANADREAEELDRASKLLAAAEPQLKAVVAADRRITDAAELLDKAQQEEAGARKGLEDARRLQDTSLGRAAEAARILEDAETALERGRHADMAATLRAGLELDEPCPVCDQLVAELPDAVNDPHLDELEKIVGSARTTKAEVDKAHTDTLTTIERAKAQLKAAQDRVAAADSQLSSARTDAARARGDLEETNLRLEKILGPGDPEENLRTRRVAYDSLTAARDRAQRRVDQIRGQHDQTIRDEQTAMRTLQDLSVRLSDLAARLDVELTIGSDPEALGDALQMLRSAWQDATVGLRAQLDEAQQDVLIADRQHAKLLEALGVDGEVNAALAVVTDRIEQLDKAIALDAAELEQAEELTSKGAELGIELELYARINHDLTDSRFIRFLLDDERARLAELGSEHFQRLSAGRYRFAGDQFDILDLAAADATRRADSLSGGETFLASLGLALALAEMVAGTGGRLDAFFLDEGFGTLDPEHLDLAMEGVETLVAEQSGRLVVIVSHVPELRERIEDLIELERNPVTGDTKVITG